MIVVMLEAELVMLPRHLAL